MTKQKTITAPELVAIRKSLKWTQQKMADYAETPVSTYRKWEQEQRTPSGNIPSLIVRLLVAEGILTQQQVDDIITSK